MSNVFENIYQIKMNIENLIFLALIQQMNNSGILVLEVLSADIHHRP